MIFSFLEKDKNINISKPSFLSSSESNNGNAALLFAKESKKRKRYSLNSKSVRQEIANEITCEIGGQRSHGNFLTVTYLVGDKLQEEVINSVI